MKFPRFRIYLDQAGKYRWRLFESSDIVADCGFGYSTKRECLRMASRLRWLLLFAKVIDDTEIPPVPLRGNEKPKGQRK